MADEVECLLLSVGGTMAPLRVALETLNPRKAIFFVSRATRPLVQNELHPSIPHAFVCLQEDPHTENLDACITRLLEGVPQALHDLASESLAWPDAVDFTGGTKVMSAALVWSALHHGAPLHYVGSGAAPGRDKAGVGRVLDGAERLKTQPQNQTLHLLELSHCENAYTEHRFERAALCAKKAAAYLAGASEEARLADALALAMTAMAQRDRFDFKAARQSYGKIQRALGTVPRPPKGTFAFRNQILNRIPRELRECQQLCEGNAVTPLLLRELWENARRRVDESRWEDANARLYALLERLIQYQLNHVYQLNPSNCRSQDLPESLREDFTRKYRQADGNLRFGCLAAARLLQALRDPMLQDAEELQRLEKLLLARNQSILAHGTQPVQQEHVDAMTAFLVPKLEPILEKA